jgi:hypothetical protein
LILMLARSPSWAGMVSCIVCTKPVRKLGQ